MNGPIRERYKLKIVPLNALNILNNKDEIDVLINGRKIDILCTNETWLLPDTPMNSLQYPVVLYKDITKVGEMAFVLMMRTYTTQVLKD